VLATLSTAVQVDVVLEGVGCEYFDRKVRGQHVRQVDAQRTAGIDVDDGVVIAFRADRCPAGADEHVAFFQRHRRGREKRGQKYCSKDCFEFHFLTPAKC
jgi:hypothetical protein